MKYCLLLLLLFFSSTASHGQLNTELVAHFPYNDKASDVWGYTAPDGTEYVMIGLHHGVSFVSLADPANPQEVAFLPGDFSRWRDLRTYGHYAYVVADQPSSKEGLWAIDMSGLPGSVVLNKTLYTFDNAGGGIDTVYNCHNVWADENGFIYMTGCDHNSGGVLMFDVKPNPMQPVFVGKGVDTYSHDNYVRGDTLYTSEINKGQFGIYDIADKANPLLIAVQETPFRFTHNTWLSDNSRVIFTTDERANAPVAAFDISDPSDIFLLDEFRPAATLGTGVIPHNVHVKDDYLVISHYTDGCVIVDANKPDNLVEVANYDTNKDFVNGFHGAWGAYPFFPSGLVAVSDIENGLFILRPDYQRACYLEGRVTDITTGAGIPNAEVSIIVTAPTLETTNLSGHYKTGFATPGTFNVAFRAKGYFDQFVLATMTKGQVTALDVQMVPLPRHPFTGKVLDETDGSGIAGATVFLENEDFTFEATSGTDGSFSLPNVVQGTYDIYVGKWGYGNLSDFHRPIKQGENRVFELPRGYADNFSIDLGWTVSGNAATGAWIRDVPFGTSYIDHTGTLVMFNPFTDSPLDEGARCYVTGNKPNLDPFVDNVGNGTTVLTSPVMALASKYDRPVLSYDLWWHTVTSNNFPDDTIRVWLTNGADTTLLEEYGSDRTGQTWQSGPLFGLADLLSLTDNMRLIVSISDLPATPNIVEVGLDHFQVRESTALAATQTEGAVEMLVFPNPSRSGFTVKYAAPTGFEKMEVMFSNTLGQCLETVTATTQEGQVQIGGNCPPGIYFIRFLLDGKTVGSARVVKG